MKNSNERIFFHRILANEILFKRLFNCFSSETDAFNGEDRRTILIGRISTMTKRLIKIRNPVQLMIDMLSSPARPMDLDEDTDYFPSSTTTFQSRPAFDGHQTPRTKLFFSSQDHHCHQTPPLFRIVHNPFDPPTSAHLKQRLASPSIFRVLSQNDDNEKVNIEHEIV